MQDPQQPMPRLENFGGTRRRIVARRAANITLGAPPEQGGQNELITSDAADWLNVLNQDSALVESNGGDDMITVVNAAHSVIDAGAPIPEYREPSNLFEKLFPPEDPLEVSDNDTVTLFDSTDMRVSTGRGEDKIEVGWSQGTAKPGNTTYIDGGIGEDTVVINGALKGGVRVEGNFAVLETTEGEILKLSGVEHVVADGVEMAGHGLPSKPRPRTRRR